MRITFIQPDGVRRDLEDVQPGRSVMEVGREHGVDGILADCGGSCACATCHVFVDETWAEAIGPPNDIEAALLDMIEGVQPGRSRLSCQISLEPALDGLTVTVADNS